MKNLTKIYLLFAAILVLGIFFSVISINATLDKNFPSEKTVENKTDTLFLLKSKNT